MPSDPRVQIRKETSAWGNVSYDVLVDGKFVGNYRYKADAARVGEEHIKNEEEANKQMDDDLRAEFGE